MRLMTFVNPVFHKGRNCTVRRGKFWGCLKEGDEIALVMSLANSKERVIARVEEVRTLRYRELKSKEIELEHIERYRGRKKELLREMKEMHKGKRRTFSANETVTVVYFTVRYRAYIDSYGRLMHY